MPIISAHNLYKTYKLGKVMVPVLRGAEISAEAGEWIAVLGASGSGKSTLLHILGALDRPDTGQNNNGGGTVVFKDQNVHKLSAKAANVYRNLSVGFVFQFYHLLPEMNVLENTSLAAMVRYGRFGYKKRLPEISKRATELLESFELGDRLKHKPAELSGGERQRVAIARALMNEPDILLADEPTGNLDAITGSQILDVIAKTHKEKGQTIIMVTHDQTVADRADRIVRLKLGVIQQQV